jgi:hypothetical protein
MQTQRSNKRIVSKAEYVGIMSGRALGFTASLFFYVAGTGGAVLSGFAIFALFVVLISSGGHAGFLLLILVVAIAFCLLCTGLAVMGWAGIKSMGEEEEIVPWTRQTALDIPAEESLVRASSANTLAAETVLLRPAQAQSEIDGEELLRPHSSQ